MAKRNAHLERGVFSVIEKPAEEKARGVALVPVLLDPDRISALEAIQGQLDGLFDQLPYKFHLEEVTSVRD
jgi:hypothetical protein